MKWRVSRPTTTLVGGILLSFYAFLLASAPLYAEGSADGSAEATEAIEAGERIPAFYAEYAVKYGILTLGRSTLELKYPQPRSYRYRMFVAPQGMARALLGTNYTDTSAGRITKIGALRPEHFRHERDGREEKVEEIIFAHDAGEIRFDDKPSIELQPQHVDRLLPQLLIMRDLLRGDRDKLTYSIVDGGKVKEYTFRRLGREEIHVPAGSFEAEKIRLHRDDAAKESNAWLDPQRHNLPLKIEHIAGGQRLVMELRAVEGELAK